MLPEKDIIFLEYFIPLLTIFLTIFLRIVSRNDRSVRFRKGDLAIGFDISATALILYVVGIVNLTSNIMQNPDKVTALQAQRLLSAPWILFAFLLGTWCISTLIRWYGWERGEPHLIFGVAIPNLWGLSIFTLSVFLLGSVS